MALVARWLPALLAAAWVAQPAAGQGQSIAWSYVPVSATAPTTLEAPPIGCSCVTTDVPCTKYECGCTCNLQAGACDPNCCCDPECSADEVSRFRSLSSCLPEGPVNLTLRTCVDVDGASALVYVNPTARMTVERTPGMERVLCISADNNPLRGSFLTDPGTQSASLLSSPSYTRAHSYKAPARTIATSTSFNAFYDVGQRIPAAIFNTGTSSLRSGFNGYWSLATGAAPTSAYAAAAAPGGLASGTSSVIATTTATSTTPSSPDAFATLAGECADGSAGGATVAYRVNRPLAKCLRSAPLTAAFCESLSGARLVRNLQLGASPQATVATPSSFVAVSLGSVFTMNTTTGDLTPVTPATTTGAALIDAAAFTSTGSGCTCTSAVVGASFRVSYSDAANTITSVAVDVVLADISQDAATCSAATPVAVPLASSVTFTPDAASLASMTRSFDASNVVQSERSGYPGYRQGKPVLAGAVQTITVGTDSKSALARSAPPDAGAALVSAAANTTGIGTSVFGLYVRGPAEDGTCTALPTVTASLSGTIVTDPAAPLPVTFREDMVAGCALQLTAAQLAAHCTANPPAALAYMGVGSVDPSGTGLGSAFGSRTAFTHVGSLGNSDPLKLWEWVRLEAPASAPTPGTWDATTGTCTGLVTGVDVEFLTARVGEAHNPQYKIVAARWSYATDTWRYGREDVRVAGGGAAQAFALRTTVTWVEMTQTAQDWIAPAPPVVPPLPSDLFYPFVTTTATGDSALTVSGAASASAGVPLLAAALLLATVAPMLRGDR